MSAISSARSRRSIRKIARRRAEGREEPVELTRDTVVELLGAPRFLDEEIEERTKNPGVAIGMAWTPVGGEVLFIEASRMQGAGTLTLTGHLGDVMKESARAALSWFRAHAAQFNVDPDFYKSSEIHLHVPSGAIPKDGPSAGVTMAVALASELTGRPVRGDIAMTGEITLSGRVLPVGGIKEKVLAARRLGVKEIILPRQNDKDVKEDLNEELRRDLTIHLVSTIDEAVLLALTPPTTDASGATDGDAGAEHGAVDAGDWNLEIWIEISDPRSFRSLVTPTSSPPPSSYRRSRPSFTISRTSSTENSFTFRISSGSW